MHNAGLSGEPIGEPQICSKTEVPMENWVIFKDIRMMRSMSRMKIFLVTLSVRHVRPLTTSPVVLPGVAFTEMTSSGSVLMRVERNCKVSRQLAMKRSVSILVKKPARSWLCIRGVGNESKSVSLRSLMRSKTSPFARLWGNAWGRRL